MRIISISLLVLMFFICGQFHSMALEGRLSPEEVVKEYVEYWINGDPEGMYSLMYVDKMNEFMDKKTKKDIDFRVEAMNMRPLEFIGIFQDVPFYKVRYAVRVPETWGVEDNIINLKVFLAKNSKNEWKILGKTRFPTVSVDESLLGKEKQSPEEVVIAFANAWVNGNADEMLTYYYKEDVSPEIIEKTKAEIQRFIDHEIKPLEFLGVINSQLFVDVDYAMKVNRMWRADNNMPQVRVTLTQDSHSDWKIVKDERVFSSVYKKGFHFTDLSDVERTKCEKTILGYVNAIVEGDVPEQMTYFLQYSLLTEEMYSKLFNYMIDKTTRPFKFARIENMKLIGDGAVEAEITVQVPSTVQPSPKARKLIKDWKTRNSSATLKIVLVKKESDGEWKVWKVTGYYGLL